MSKSTTLLALSAIAFGALAADAAAQSDRRLVVPLSDPARPAILDISVFSGEISVEGYDGNEIVIVADAPVQDANRQEEPRPDGLRRLQSSSVGVTVEENDNTVSVQMDFGPREVELDIRVPRRTSVRVNSVNGDINVIGVTGEHELQSVNGDVTATDIAGSAVINTTNGDVRAMLTSVDAARPMSFTSFNGDVDIRLPANIAADLIVASQQGEVFTDFDAVPQQDPTVVERNPNAGGRYRVRMQRQTRYTIGGGGPDIQLRTFNGDITIRKR